MVEYIYDSWGKVLSATGTYAGMVGLDQPFRYRGYVYDTETQWYYLQSRYYDPNTCRFISADVLLSTGQGVIGHNSFAYCLNNPVGSFDDDGELSLPNWAKVVIGVVATVAAVAVTVATGGAAAPVLIGVAASTIVGAAGGAISHRVKTGSWKGAGKSAVDGACNGFMWGGIGALAGSVIGGAIRTAKNVKYGLTIGKSGRFEEYAKILGSRHYKGLKEFKLIKALFGQKAAETIGWWQNKSIVKGVMLFKGIIYDSGGELTGAYAKEIILTRGYEFLYRISFLY